MSTVQVKDEEGKALTMVRVGDTKVKALQRIGAKAGVLNDKDGVGLLDDDQITAEGAPYIFKPTQRQAGGDDVKHRNVAEGVFVLYRGNDTDATPIGTAFAIATDLLLTACHNVVQKDGSEVTEVTELKVTTRMSKSADFKFVADEMVRKAEIYKYNTDVDWACLKLVNGAVPMTCIIPIGMGDSDLPKPAALEKLFIYHCPVQLFLDDEETEVCHVMVKEASVGLVGKKVINFQNGAFPGSCGGPYIFRNKAIALHVDSVSTTKTAEMLKDERVETQNGRKRKLTDAEVTRKMADSCVSSHTSLGSGIILHVRSGIRGLVMKSKLV